MVVTFSKKEEQYHDLLDIIENCKNEEFYLTHNNERVYVTNSKHLKMLLKESHHVYYENSFGKGIILVWKSNSGELERNYIKVIADNANTVRRLLTILLWNYNKILYAKIKKNSNYTFVFKEKGFKFIGGRGSEILLEKTKSHSE